MSTRLLILAVGLVLAAVSPMAQSAPPSDLDAFMSRVLARRDDNWTKLQQYTLDEVETLQVTGPQGVRIFGEQREYRWFPRAGYFIRSPRRANGVDIDDDTRQKEEEQWREKRQEREQRRAARRRGTSPAPTGPAADRMGDVLNQGMEPEFVSLAYFLEFQFDEGHYALVGRETLLDRDVLRIEYYPTKLFTDHDRDRNESGGGREGDKQGTEDTGKKRQGTRRSDAEDAKIERQMNKSARVTLWVDPAEHQILQYELHNIDMDFLRGRSMVRIDELNALMRMGQPFPGVWLPETVGFRLGMTTAVGRATARYDVRYFDYRLPAVTTRVR